MATWGPTEIAETDDDCRYIQDGAATMAPNDSDGQHLGFQGGQTKNNAYRFPGITIPQGATIDSATLKITIGYENLGAGEAITAAIYAFDVDDCPNFNADDSGTDPSSHDKTTESVAWNWDDTVTTGQKTSDDIKAVIQEIVNRDGWSSGNAIGISYYVSAADDYIQIEDYEQSSEGQRVILEIDYTEAAPAGNIIPHLIYRQFMARN